MEIFKDRAKLKDYLCRVLENNGPKIISMDGKDGAGKTDLSKYLAAELNLCHLELDDKYLIRDKGAYVKYIKYEILAVDIERMIPKQSIIIDGICMLAILEKLGLKSDLKIYVKKVIKIINGSIWIDGNDYNYSQGVDKVLEEKNRQVQLIENMTANSEGRKSIKIDVRKSVSTEILKYHFGFQPDITADIIFERSKDKD